MEQFNYNFNISNTKNYNKDMRCHGIENIYKSICNLMAEFLIYTVDNIKVQNNKYYLFIIKRGLETLIHCYRFLLMYTRNFEMALFHCKKAFIYYVEFIGQIGYNSNSYLQLNSKDATLFVYKKTIFDIDNDERRELSLLPEEILYLEITSNIITLYKKLILIILENNADLQKSLAPIIHFCTKHTSKIIENVYNNKITPEQNLDNIKKVLYFVEGIVKKDINNSLYFVNIINSFVKKIKKSEIKYTDLHSKLSSEKFNEILNKRSYIKLINWLFAN